MSLSSKFAPNTNMLGTQNLEVTYLVAADNFVTTQLYANVILKQPNLDISQLDPGLSTLISAFQARMKSNANFFRTRLMPNFIMTTADGSNFAALVDTWFSIGRTDIINAYENTANAKLVSISAQSLANQADDINVDVNTLNASFAASEKSINSFVANYNSNLTKAVTLLSVAAQQISSDIDDLQAAIAQNIKDIVQGGKELGNAVTQLGTGFLTTISGAAKDPVSEEEEEEEEEIAGVDNKVKDKKTVGPKKDDQEKSIPPNVEFAVQAIQAGVSGETKASAAMQALNSNNIKLAAAYQKMAQENVLVTIAKVIQVQNQLFLDTLNAVGLNINDMNTEWSAVEHGYSNFSQDILNLKSQADATNYSVKAQGARSKWNALGGQISYIKSALAHVS